MPPQAIKAKRRGGGGSLGGGGRSSSPGSSAGSTSSAPKPAPAPKAIPAPAPKVIPAPAPKSVPAAPPNSKPPPLIVPPTLMPPDIVGEKSDKGKSEKKYPSLPKPPKGFKPKHNDHHGHDSRTGYNDADKGLPGSPGPRGRDIGIAFGVIFGVIIVAIIIWFCCKRGRRWRNRIAERRTVFSWHDRVTERRTAFTNRGTHIELRTHSAAKEPKKPKRAFFKGQCFEKIVMLRKQLGRMDPTAKSKGDNEPSYLEAGLAGETDNSRGSDPSSREEPVVSVKGSADGMKGSDGLPAYIEEDGVGHCKDPENPCRNAKVPHICVEWPSEK